MHCAWTRKQITDCHLYLAAPRIHVTGKSNLLSRFTRNEFNLEVRFLTGGDCEARTPDPQMPEWDSRCNAVQRPDCAPLTDGVLRSIALGLACSVPCSPSRRSALSSRRSRFSRMAKPSRRRFGTRQDRSDTERSRRRQSTMATGSCSTLDRADGIRRRCWHGASRASSSRRSDLNCSRLGSCLSACSASFSYYRGAVGEKEREREGEVSRARLSVLRS